jgi:hypothetical protein
VGCHAVLEASVCLGKPIVGAKVDGCDGTPTRKLTADDPAPPVHFAVHRHTDLDIGLNVVEGVVANEGRARGGAALVA